MDYAIQLFLPILGGLLLGNWLHQAFGLSYLWTLLLAVLGMIGGIGVLYKRQMIGSQSLPKVQFPSNPKPEKEKGAHTGSEKSGAEPTSSQGMSHQELLELYKKADREPPTDDFALDDLLGDDDAEKPDDFSKK